MKVYIAAPYALRDVLRQAYLSQLEDAGHTCMSSWLNESVPIGSTTTGSAPGVADLQAQAHVDQDIADVLSSDALVLVTWRQAALLSPKAVTHPNSGGRHVETGMALVMRTPVVVWGPEPENIFHRGVDAYLAPTWRSVLDTLADLSTPVRQGG